MGQIDYNGRDNLEVMKEADNYNQFLLGLTTFHANYGELIVDFGAGSGTFSIPIKEKGFRVICVEPDKILSASLKRFGLEVVSDLELIEDGSVDYIYSLNVLEHIENDNAIVDLWFRKLRSGGQLFVYVPAFQVLYSSMDSKVGHYRRYTKRILNKKLKSVGFEVVQSRYADSIGFIATLVYKLFDDGKGDIDLKVLKIYDRWIFPLSRFIDFFINSFIGKNIYSRAVKGK